MFDLAGRVAESRRLDGLASGPHWIPLDAARLAPGLYLLELEAEGTRLTRRMVVTR